MTAHSHKGPNGQRLTHDHTHGDVEHDHGHLRPFTAWKWEPGTPTTTEFPVEIVTLTRPLVVDGALCLGDEETLTVRRDQVIGL